MAFKPRYTALPQEDYITDAEESSNAPLLELLFQDETDDDWSVEEVEARARIDDWRVELCHREAYLDEVRACKEDSRRMWEAKMQKLDEERQALLASIEEKQAHLNALYAEEEEEVIPPSGPECFMVVESTKFVVISSIILVTNIVTMVMEMLHPHYKREFFWLDQFFMVFYLVEFFMKAVLHQRRLLCGEVYIVWWNWLDLIVISVGVMDMWGKTLFLSLTGGDQGKQHKSQSASVMQCVRLLRLARLARVLKIVRIFFHSDLSWAEGSSFQLFIMGVIGFNSLLMAFESDYPSFFLWFYVEQGLLLIFSFELAIRLRLWGCLFFTRKEDVVWNVLDFTVVVGGIVDQWLMPSVAIVQTLLGMEQSGTSNMKQIMVMLRMARLLRILRLVRLVRSVPPLFTLIVGIIQAMQGMMWVLVLTTVLLYVFALLAVKLIGHGLLFGGDMPSQVSAIFPTVPQSMFVLFMAMNGDSDLLEPMFDFVPMSRVIYVAYMVLSSWAILSILTAVISENMISVTEATKEELAHELHLKEQEENLMRLRGLVEMADINASGTIDRCEFYRPLSSATRRGT
eukprot:TRINITY_DN14136_c0_g3_i1.p1 TRINITY_DN14136_c0_g3~~TRINITY_DN14136_c0_g3_i1.p1  ORF type:complete len:578 (+),score=166.88 TRINITY_DN14136_c0_g3_i1:24-1736(+)